MAIDDGQQKDRRDPPTDGARDARDVAGRDRVQRERARAVERNEARRAQSARLVRTILLGTVAMVAGVFWVGDQYGVERDVLIEFLLTSFLFVGMLILAGLGGAFLLKGLRQLGRRD